jgi:hypothetical protein
LPVRPASRHSSLESARRQPENQPPPSDVTAQTRAILPVTGVSLSALLVVVRSGCGRRGFETLAPPRMSGVSWKPDGVKSRDVV